MNGVDRLRFVFQDGDGAPLEFGETTTNPYAPDEPLQINRARERTHYPHPQAVYRETGGTNSDIFTANDIDYYTLENPTGDTIEVSVEFQLGEDIETARPRVVVDGERARSLMIDRAQGTRRFTVSVPGREKHRIMGDR